MSYIKIVDPEVPDMIVNVPTNEDGTLELSSLKSQFPGASGLRYHLQDYVRGVKMVGNQLHPPEGGWNKSTVYICVFPRGKSKYGLASSVKRLIKKNQHSQRIDYFHS